jgi:hypothetical protein
MLMNILYYGMDNTPNADGLSFGPINVTLQQVSVGIITNLIVFPPSFLLVQLFKRTKQRLTRLSKIKTLLNKHNPIENKEEEGNEENNKIKEKSKLELKFPWWFKFVLYVVSFIIASVCLFFIVIKGIVFGNDKSTKWITSVVVSILSSILVTQPLQVLI